MRRKLINSQLTNLFTYQMWLRRMLTLAENVFTYKNMPNSIFKPYMNKQLVRKTSIAFFEDDVFHDLRALPYKTDGKLDIYGLPSKGIQVVAKNGWSRWLDEDEYVIMYDNNGMYPLWLDILQFAERMALNDRTIDVNIAQQKTPRLWTTSEETRKSLEDLLNTIDGYENTVMAYDTLNLDDVNCILQPSPYVTDKLDMHKDKVWAEFLSLIGVSNLSITKKERQISDEIEAQQGGTVASRYSRFDPRKTAIDEINEKFKHLLKDGPIEVSYYDGTPNSIESEVVNNDKLQSKPLDVSLGNSTSNA